MLAFYSKSNAQVLRLFRTSMLGKRDKATKNDYYLGTTLKKVRSIAANEEVSSAVGEKIARALVLRLATTTSGPFVNLCHQLGRKPSLLLRLLLCSNAEVVQW